MRKIGLLGGMSWESTALYYKEINKEIKKRLGSLHSAKLMLSSVDFDEIEKLQHKNMWRETSEILLEEIINLQNAKAECLVICTNTMHKILPLIEKRIKIPILHIADATALKLQEDGIKKVALLGTKFTMTEDFYKKRIEDNFELEVITPSSKDQELIHKVIYEELCLGLIKKESKNEYIKIINSLKEQGAEGIILGCTEISMLIKDEDVDIILYDTTKIHALSAVDFALKS